MGKYIENENHVPNPRDQVAHFDTTGTGGATAEEAAPVFEKARARDSRRALDALEEEGETTAAVNLPEDEDERRDARGRLEEAAKDEPSAGTGEGEGSGELVFDPNEYNADVAIEEVGDEDDPDVLRAALKAEEDGKDRSTVKDAIEARLDALEAEE